MHISVSPQHPGCSFSSLKSSVIERSTLDQDTEDLGSRLHSEKWQCYDTLVCHLAIIPTAGN